MKEKKRIKFNPKSGMALPGVIILLFVLSMLGTAMYAYNMQSVQSVRYASDGKKAEYLAQAGVEATAYAYQAAMNNEKNLSSVTNFFLNANQVSGATIESNKVWLVFNKGIKDYQYLKSDSKPTDTSYEVIGYFEVKVEETVRNDQITVRNYNSSGQQVGQDTQKDLPSKVKIFRAVGTVNNTKRAKTGYIDDAKNAYGLYYGSNGIIDGKYTDSSSAAPKSQATEKFIESGSFQTSSTLSWKFKWLNLLFGEGIQPSPINVDSETIPFALCFSSGNLILDTPKDAKNLTFATNQSNMVSFVSRNNLFVRTGVDTTSSDGRFNTLFLKGNAIVIDGNIECAAYGFTRNSAISLVNNIGILSDLMNRKYRYATVTIDALEDTAINNPYNGIPYTYARSGKIFFGGNVFINFTLPNLGTYRYKAFSAGDVYYFDADIKETYLGGVEETTDSGSNDGIDLMRYFLEYSIATNRYSQNVLNRFSDLIDFYYGNSNNGTSDKTIKYNGTQAQGAYLKWTVTSGTTVSTGASGIIYNAMRKIDIDNPDYNDSPASIVPPSPSGASGLKWGEPHSQG